MYFRMNNTSRTFRMLLACKEKSCDQLPKSYNSITKKISVLKHDKTNLTSSNDFVLVPDEELLQAITTILPNTVSTLETTAENNLLSNPLLTSENDLLTSGEFLGLENNDISLNKNLIHHSGSDLCANINTITNVNQTLSVLNPLSVKFDTLLETKQIHADEGCQEVDNVVLETKKNISNNQTANLKALSNDDKSLYTRELEKDKVDIKKYVSEQDAQETKSGVEDSCFIRDNLNDNDLPRSREFMELGINDSSLNNIIYHSGSHFNNVTIVNQDLSVLGNLNKSGNSIESNPLCIESKTLSETNQNCTNEGCQIVDYVVLEKENVSNEQTVNLNCLPNNDKSLNTRELEKPEVDITNYVSEQDPQEDNLDVEDPDYIPDNLNNDVEETPWIPEGRPKRGRKRKHPDQNRQIRKKQCNTNQDHYNAKGKKVEAKEFLGNNFNCNCQKKCTEKLPKEVRQAEFTKFWASGSYEARCAILQGCVKEVPKKRSYSSNSKRMYTRKHNLLDIEVCKKTFLNTFGISQTRIDSALSKQRSQEKINDKRGLNSGGKNAISEEELQKIRLFIKSLPKYTSHYCRNSTTANFLSPNLNLQIIYDLYKEKCPEGVSLSRFRVCFYKDFNLRFKKPQKDTCLRCDTYKAKRTGANDELLNELERQHNDHLEKAYSLRNQMKTDLALAKTDPEIETLTFDLEKTHSLPLLPTSIVYYKRQLNLYNQGVHCGSSGKGYFYVWLEHEASRGTQEVGSCLRKFINEHLKPTTTHLILWSDSCGGQNRSIKMVLFLLHILQNHSKLEKISLRFLHPGHTYLPNDSEFGDLECALKTHSRLYTDEDYMNIMKKCRRKNQFVVTRLQKEDFRSIAPLENVITNRKVDIDKNKISWLNTFEIELKSSSPSKIYMRSKLTDNPQVVDISKSRKGKSRFDKIELPLLWPNGRELSDAKVKDLKEIIKLVPNDSKSFYQFLKTVKSGEFVDDLEGFGLTIDFDTEQNVDIDENIQN